MSILKSVLGVEHAQDILGDGHSQEVSLVMSMLKSILGDEHAQEYPW